MRRRNKMKFKVGDKVRVSIDAQFYPNVIGEIIGTDEDIIHIFKVQIKNVSEPTWYHESDLVAIEGNVAFKNDSAEIH